MLVFLNASVDIHAIPITLPIVDWTLVCSGESMFRPLLRIGAKTPTDYAETVPNNVLNFQHVAVFDQL